VRLAVVLSVAHGLRCWEGSSTQSQLALGPPFAQGMREVDCSGACHLVSDRCEDDAAAVTVARCVDTCPSSLASCEICCQSDLCNSKKALSLVKLDAPLHVFSLPINSIRVGISGSSVEKDLCATVVLLDPVQEGCVSEAARSAYVTLNRGSENCGWTYQGTAEVSAISGCWKDLQGPNPQISINVTVSSDVYSGKIRFQSALPTVDDLPVEPIEEQLIASQPVRRTTVKAPLTRITVSSKKPTDQATVTVKDKTLTVQISSPLGIGSATVTKAKGVWPKTKNVFLNVKGLEMFQVSNGNITLHASVSSASIRMWADNEAEALSKQWQLEVSVVNAAGEVVPPPYTLPLAKGLKFKIVLPNALCPRTVSSLEISWIDFYR